MHYFDSTPLKPMHKYMRPMNMCIKVSYCVIKSKKQKSFLSSTRNWDQLNNLKNGTCTAYRFLQQVILLLILKELQMLCKLWLIPQKPLCMQHLVSMQSSLQDMGLYAEECIQLIPAKPARHTECLLEWSHCFLEVLLKQVNAICSVLRARFLKVSKKTPSMGDPPEPQAFPHCVATLPKGQTEVAPR